jgi:hypothetical protein
MTHTEPSLDNAQPQAMPVAVYARTPKRSGWLKAAWIMLALCALAAVALVATGVAVSSAETGSWSININDEAVSMVSASGVGWALVGAVAATFGLALVVVLLLVAGVVTVGALALGALAVVLALVVPAALLALPFALMALAVWGVVRLFQKRSERAAV